MPTTLLERPAEGVALVRFNRPEARNALNQQVREELAAHLQALTDDASVRCAVLTGNDRYFVGGADLKEMAPLDPVAHLTGRHGIIWQALRAFPKPLIAAVNGYALGGGCEVALHCDIIVAGEGAQFGQPELKVGIMPGGGGTQRLTRAVGKYQAMRVVLTGDPVGAAEALRMGLASEVVPDAAVLDRALELARKIAALPPLAVQLTKELVVAADNAPLDVGVALERKAYQLLFATEDQKEGMRAFAEKRPPAFKGR